MVVQIQFGGCIALLSGHLWVSELQSPLVATHFQFILNCRIMSHECLASNGFLFTYQAPEGSMGLKKIKSTLYSCAQRNAKYEDVVSKATEKGSYKHCIMSIKELLLDAAGSRTLPLQ